ncbi:3'-5' DNA helicase [Exophiala oligosperma]
MSSSSSDDNVLVPSSQTDDDDNPRARKRQRRSRPSSHHDDEEDEYDLPSYDDEVDEANVEGEEENDDNNRKSKYEDRTHYPEAERQPDTFVTQLTQQWSSPSRIRGARWMKPRDSPSPSPARLPSARSTIVATGVGASTNNLAAADDFEVEDEDEDDIALLAAFEAVETAAAQHDVVPAAANGNAASNSSSNATAGRGPIQRSTSFRQTTLHGMHTTQQDPAPPSRTQQSQQAKTTRNNWPLVVSRNETPTHHSIDREAMATWVYPTNLGRIRDYQYNIVHKGLFHNLLVALPTGLGKTFIAATVMLNWFRWTRDAQIIFVAPTKPLVSQQIDACFNIAGIPRSETTMLTGEVSPGIRAEEWQEKRVFFMTPQTLINDLKNGMADPKKIVLVVVDEAHKATGNYAYVEVVKFLRRFNMSFRVLALTATPGATVEAVQEVIDGLGIARTEIRTEESLDIRDFVHARNVETQIFENSDEMSMCLELFSSAIQPLMNKLNSQNAYWGKDPEKITLYGLKMAQDKWRVSEAGRRASQGIKGMVSAIFAVVMSLAHSLELLKYHGIGPFYHKLKLFASGETGKGKYAKQITDDENFKKLMSRLQIWINDPNFIGHPKLSYLKEVVLNHFLDAGEGRGGGNTSQPANTRIMIFAHYRDSAEEITRVLNRHGPMIRAHVFVGQSGTKGSEGMDQKTQLDIIKKFKAGTYNTIVATSIGEEGLDIGEVDLIVCYDCSKSPIRMLQRMGRTGRKRAGNIVLLLMRGKEEHDFFAAKDNYQKMQEKIESGREFQYHEDLSPRIIPREIVPSVDKRVVEIPIENTQPGSLEPKKRRRAKNPKKPAKKFHMPDGVETGFTFLGKGKKAKQHVQKEEAKTKTIRSRTDRAVASLPSLETVLLTTTEEEQLDDRYVKLTGTAEDQYIQHVRFDAFPRQQQRLGRTMVVKHSRATETLVKAFKAMHDPLRDWEPPWEDERLDGDTDKRSAAAGATTRRRKDTIRRAVERSTRSSSPLRPSLATNEPLGQYDYDGGGGGDDGEDDDYDQDSFIDDGSLAQSGPGAESSDRDLSPPEPSPVALTKPFWISQESVGFDDAGGEEELPELASLFGNGKSGGQATTSATSAAVVAASQKAGRKWKQPPVSNNSKPSRARRVIDSDDEDEST